MDCILGVKYKIFADLALNIYSIKDNAFNDHS